MIERLSDGPASLGDLAAPLAMTLSAAEQHLRALERCGLVRSEKRGRVRYCRLDPGAMSAAESWISERRALWSRRMDRLGEVLDSTADVATADVATADVATTDVATVDVATTEGESR